MYDVLEHMLQLALIFRPNFMTLDPSRTCFDHLERACVRAVQRRRIASRRWTSGTDVQCSLIVVVESRTTSS